MALNITELFRVFSAFENIKETLKVSLESKGCRVNILQNTKINKAVSSPFSNSLPNGEDFCVKNTSWYLGRKRMISFDWQKLKNLLATF